MWNQVCGQRFFHNPEQAVSQGLPVDYQSMQGCDWKDWKLFSDISHLLKSTSASKIMHMVNPNLFIMWDEKIRNHWGCEENENGYINFLIRMNLEYRELINNFAKIEQISIAEADKKFLQNLNQRIERNISITRWVDIYNWTKFTRKEKL